MDVIAWLVMVSQEATPRIDTIWPTSVAGWLTLALSSIAVLGYGITAWKSSNRPILLKLEEARAYFTKELNDAKAEFREKITTQETHIDESLDQYHTTVTSEINGWAKRFSDDHGDIQRHEMALGDLSGKLIESRADREQLNRRYADLAREVSENAKEARAEMRSLKNEIGEMERRLIDVITGRKRP